MIWDYVFIGAGPASLAAGAELARATGASVRIFEAGHTLRHRGCPGLKDKTCVSCAGESCHVTQGVGGSSAIFGNKTCYFPASSGILKFLSTRDRDPVERHVRRLVGDALAATTNVVPLGTSHNRKLYHAGVIFRGDYRRLVQSLVDQASGTCTLSEGTPVSDVRSRGDLIEITTTMGEKASARHLVLGTGRSAAAASMRWFEALGCEVRPNSPDVGFRIEADSSDFEHSFFYQTDPKYKFTQPGVGSSRTFCGCRGGAIIPVKHGDAFFADGAFLNADTGRTNIALMVRTDAVPAGDEIGRWLAKVNRHAGGRLLLGRVDLDAGAEDVAQSVVGLLPSWPTADHHALARDLIHKVIGGEYVRAFRQKAGTAKVYGPSIDLYWPRVTIREGFRSSVDNVSVIGDATGVSRGIVQALTSGLGWAAAEVRRKSAPSLKEAVS
ncbi:MAG: hypothetical protein M9939_15645 [Mesorhizobium sp.]|nr:hypothetical protein [Mesorhizobium sp.]MCO5162566.1 hypothetical protein [Mesorhizobium sp.]